MALPKRLVLIILALAFPVLLTFTLYDGTTGAQIGTPLVRSWGPNMATVDNLSGDSFYVVASADEPPVP
jgi:hypothetical protein